MIRRFTLLFATVWIALTVADDYTTHLAVTASGEYAELNPLGVGTVKTIIGVGTALLLLGSIAVALGAWGLGKHPPVRDANFKIFLREAFTGRRMIWAWLILGPLLFAFGRALPVLSNLSFLFFGTSPLMSLVARCSHVTGTSEFTVYLVCLVGLMWILFLPVTYVMHLLVQHTHAEQSHGETTSDSAPSAESEASHA